jgi:hypothetical protein
MRQDKQRSLPTHPCCEPLEERLVFGIDLGNGEFAIDPPGGGQGYSDVITHPMTGVIGLRSAEANSNRVVNWELTTIHEWTPGDHAGPHQFAS